jgi:mannose-1-phosphate guanylyltransferase/mannose-6-phosphate isomerase
MSRRKRPKQFLELGGTASLLRRSWDRARALAPASRIWVVVPRALASAVRRELPALRAINLVVEPSARDTGPAVALACAAVERRDPNAVIAVFPTDHVIRDRRALVRAVRTAVGAASKGALVCLGIEPDRPSTGFGYLRLAAARRGLGAIPVKKFIEKPDAPRARRFVRSRRYVWNSGIFVFTAGAFFEELRRVAPALHAAAKAIGAGRPRAWSRAPRVSIDRALMEKAARVVAVPLDAGWDDVGSWDAAVRLAGRSEGRRGGTVLVDSAGSVVFGRRRVIAVLGVPGIVVVDTPDALLIASRTEAERVREVVAELRRRGRGHAL